MSNLDIFARDMNRMAANVATGIPKMQKQVALEVVEFVARATPIDTGQASANWKTTIGTPTSAWDQGATGGPSVSISAVKAALSNLQLGQVIHITNNVPYIVKLNDGYSAQAGRHFVELAAVSALGSIGRYNLLIK